MLCPFHDGVATLDLLLAELDPQDTELFDAVLDLRSLSVAGTEPEACVEQLLRVRRILAGRHYLAFFRVRCWARRTFRIQVRAGRTLPWLSRELPLDCARIDELLNASLAAVADADGEIPASAHVRFAFTAVKSTGS
jgi:hypothetical protein